MALYGVNDINTLNASYSDVILAYKYIIKNTHKNNFFIFADIISPYRIFWRWTEEKGKIEKK